MFFCLRLTAAAALLAMAGGDSYAQTTFFPSGFHSYGPYISANGRVAAGRSDSFDGTQSWPEAFYWTETGGYQKLGVLADNLEGSFLPRESFANAVSADGSTIVGNSSNSDGVTQWTEAFRWTEATGMQGLGALTDGVWSGAIDVSANGAVIVGAGGNGDGNTTWSEAFRWTEATGMQGLGLLGYDPAAAGIWGKLSQSTAVSADGSTVVGMSTNSDGISNWIEGFRWTESGGLEGLGTLTGGNSHSEAVTVSSDGAVIAGWTYNTDGVDNWAEAFRWTEAGGLQGLGTLSSTVRFSQAVEISSDGRVIIGQSTNYAGSEHWYEAFYWSEATGIRGLGVLGDYVGGFMGPRRSDAYALSEDGSVIVGTSSNSDGTTSWDEAFRWSEATGMQSVGDWLGPEVDLTGIRLLSASDVSGDGSVVVGAMYRGSFSEAYIARAGGLITTPEALNSLYTLGQVPLAGSAFISHHLDTASEYARQHAAVATTTVIQPLRYVDDGQGAAAFTVAPSSPVRAFGYGLGSGTWNYDGWSGASLAGMSITLGDNLIFGGSIGYGAVSSDMNLGGKATLHGPAGTLFIAATPETGFQFLATGTIVGFGAEITRGYMNGNGMSASAGETDGIGYGGQVRAGYAFEVDERNRLEPFAAFQAVHSRLDAYTETSGPFPAEISRLSHNDQIGRLGAEVRHRYQPDAWVWGSAAWAHRFNDSGVDLSVQLIDLFGVSGTAPVGSSDWMEASFGISLPVSATMRMTGSVTAGIFGEGSDTLLGRLGISAAF